MVKKTTIAVALSEILVKNNAVSREIADGLEEGFARSAADNFCDFLLTDGIVDRDEILKALSDYYKTPSMDVVGEFFDSVLLRNFPKEFLARNAIVPLEEENANMLVMVAADPEQDGLESAIRGFTNSDITFLVGLRQDIVDTVDEYYDKAVTEEIPEDLDLHAEHREDVDAYAQILNDEEDAYAKDADLAESLNTEDDIR